MYKFKTKRASTTKRVANEACFICNKSFYKTKRYFNVMKYKYEEDMWSTEEIKEEDRWQCITQYWCCSRICAEMAVLAYI